MKQPDSKVAQRLVLSPNFGKRRSKKIDMIILHYTGMVCAREALDRLCDATTEVSCHYFVDSTGEILQLVGEHDRAWHAGVSYWRGDRDINSRSIGIEIANAGHEFGYPEFEVAQIDGLSALIHDILTRHPIPKRHVLGHSDVAVARKRDPGEKFPWERLADRGIGLFPTGGSCAGLPLCNLEGGVVKPNARGREVAWLRRELAQFGYQMIPGDVYDHHTKQVVNAFHRHFWPKQLGKPPNNSTFNSLASLNSKLG